MVADAARDRDEERGEGEAVGRCDWRGVPEGDRDGGRELRSGAMLLLPVVDDIMASASKWA